MKIFISEEIFLGKFRGKCKESARERMARDRECLYLVGGVKKKEKQRESYSEKLKLFYFNFSQIFKNI